MLGPQGTFFFLLLILAFGGLVTWLIVTKQVVFRVLAAILAFIPAMVFGIAAVNKYYDYYQTWGALFSDLSGQAQSAPQLTAAGLGKGTAKSLRSEIAGSTNAALDAQFGLLFRTTVIGPNSHLTRQVYIYLPPEYFWKTYATYKFPAVELLHGSPGRPTSWINAMDVLPIFQHLLVTRQAAPAVLVMPDTDGGGQYALECLNDPHGLQDMTFVGQEVPNWVATTLRVQRPGLMWGVAGYSEGGFCAANIALQYATRFGYAGVLSGYFAPGISQVPIGGKPGGRPHDINVFAHNRSLELRNTPDWLVLHEPLGIDVPQFFLAVGAENLGDVRIAQYFRQLLMMRVPDVPLMIVPGAGHGAMVWRTALGPMLRWMTPQLAWQVKHFSQVAATQHAARLAAARAAARAAASERAAANRLPPKTPHLLTH